MRPQQTDLTRESHIPLYAQIASHLAREIETGALGSGQRLDPEHLLAARFKVSRITVRQAMVKLVETGLVVRKQGKGSYVKRPAVQFDLQDRRGFFDVLFEQGRKPQTTLLSFGLELAPPRTRRALGIEGDSGVLLQRLYLADGQPIAVGNGWMRPEAQDISWADADAHSTAWILRERLDTPIEHSEMAIRADVAGKSIGKLLDIPPRNPILIATRTSYDAQQRGVEFAQFFLNSEAYEFTFGTESPSAFGATIRMAAAE